MESHRVFMPQRQIHCRAMIQESWALYHRTQSLHPDKGCLEHLGNERKYKQLTANEAKISIKCLHYALGPFIRKYAKIISNP